MLAKSCSRLIWLLVTRNEEPAILQAGNNVPPCKFMQNNRFFVRKLVLTKIDIFNGFKLSANSVANFLESPLQRTQGPLQFSNNINFVLTS